ncbi:MAG: hypothetical protein RLZZ214_554 [Verrucomicrobiota bacterium]|jgi:hypothetical protein
MLIPACASSTKEKTDEEKPKSEVQGPKLVGRIASVPADKRFVLIQSYGPWEIETGRILTTRGLDNRTANLRTTGEKLGEFAAADLQSGTAEVGDAVYSQHVPKPVQVSEAPDILPTQVEPIAETVQKNN